MYIRPIHYWLATAVSLSVVLMIAIAAQTVFVLSEKPDVVVKVEEDQRSPENEPVDKEEILEELAKPPTEVMILPPRDRARDVAKELPETWREMLSEPEQFVVPEPEPSPEEEKIARERYTRLVESLGQASEKPPEDTNAISDRDMTAASALAAADPDGEEVPTTDEGMEDERLDSLVETKYGEGELPGDGGVLSLGSPAPIAQAASSGAAAKVVEDVMEIPGLQPVPVEPEVTEAEKDESKGVADTGDSEEQGKEGEASIPNNGQGAVTSSGGGSGDIQRVKRRYRGRLDARGIDSLAARGTEIGKYLSGASKRVTKNWQRACHDPVNGSYITNGMIRVVMEIRSDGRVGLVNVEHADGVTEVQKLFTTEAVKGTPLPAFPDSLKSEIGEEPIEVVFDFLFFVG